MIPFTGKLLLNMGVSRDEWPKHYFEENLNPYELPDDIRLKYWEVIESYGGFPDGLGNILFDTDEQEIIFILRWS